MKSRSTPDIDNSYAYFDYEIKAVNDARNAKNNYKIIDGALCECKDDELYFCGPNEDTMVVELEPFWLMEGVNHFSKNLFEPLLNEIKDDFLNQDLNFKRVKFLFPYRLKNSWHWNAAELIFSLDEDENWHASGAKYDPYGTKRALEDRIVRDAAKKFSEIFEITEVVLVDEVEEIKFASGQRGGVGCGMYTAFMLHKLKTQDFFTKEELENPQNGIWSGLAASEEQQRAKDLELVANHLPERLEKFGKINEGNFVNSLRYLPSRLFKSDEANELSDQVFQYLRNVVSICQELDVQELKSLFQGDCNQVVGNVLSRFSQVKKDDDQLAEKLDQIGVYMMLSLEEVGQQNVQKFTEYLKSAIAAIVKDGDEKSADSGSTNQFDGALDKLDPFSYQIHRHYSGILEKADAIDQNALEEKLKQISQVVKSLESDEKMREVESEIKDRIAIILKNKLLLRMAAKVFYEECREELGDYLEEFPEDEFLKKIPELKRVLNNAEISDEETYIYDNEDYFHHHLQAIQGKYMLQEIEHVLNFSAIIFKDDPEIKKLLSNPNLSLWYDQLDHHLDLYGKKIIEFEQAKKDRADEERQLRKSLSEARLEEENERMCQEEDDPDSREWDWGDFENDEDFGSDQGSDNSDDDSRESEQEGDESEKDYNSDSDQESQSESSSDEEGFYLSHYKEFSNPSSFENLIAISSNFGESSLSWLTNQIAEYETEDLWDYVIAQIIANPEMADLDSDLLKFIIYQASAFNGKVKDGEDESTRHLFNSGSLAREYDDEKLISGGFITDSLGRYLSEINQKKLSEDIKSEFAYVKEISDNGWLRELRESYNNAHVRNDLVTQNQVWSVFDLLQKNLKTLKFEEKKDSQKLLKLLEKAKTEYKERADQYYFRIYPQPETNRLVYSSKKEEKVAVIEMDKILGELEEIGQEIKKALKEKIDTKKVKDTTNVVVPVLCFVVSDRPHKDDKLQRDHGRIIIPISCDFDVPQYLLSKDAADNVVAKSDQDFFKKAKSDSKYGMEKVKAKASLASQDPEPASQNNELLSHSERTMFEAFRKEKNVRKIVTILHDELRKIYPEEISKEDRFKVYSVALLAYSSNSVCQLCSPAIIAHENYTQDSLLTLLTKNLREFTSEASGEEIKFFKVRGDVEKLEVKSSKKSKSTKQAVQADIPEGIKQKFHLTTVVTSTKPFTIQSEDMCGAGKKAKHQNPQSRIYLEKDAIDLHKHEIGKDGRPIQDHYSFYEFSQSNFKKSLEKPDYKLPKKETKEAGLDFKFTGKTFMSGSKESKISNKKNRESVDKEVKTVIEARETIRLRDLGKERFVTGVTSGNEL